VNDEGIFAAQRNAQSGDNAPPVQKAIVPAQPRPKILLFLLQIVRRKQSP
jgi:hypothetical protein